MKFFRHSLKVQTESFLFLHESMWSFAVCGSEVGTVEKCEERVINVFGTWSWRGMLEIKWADRITNNVTFSKMNEERLVLKI